MPALLALQCHWKYAGNRVTGLDPEVRRVDEEDPVAALLGLEHQHEGGVRFDIDRFERVHHEAHRS
jgi:hypothetical protein